MYFASMFLFHLGIDNCSSADCGNGICIDGVNNYTCQCDFSYAGRHCETGMLIAYTDNKYVLVEWFLAGVPKPETIGGKALRSGTRREFKGKCLIETDTK